MSAREKLIEQARLMEDEYGPTEGFDPEALVNAYAHELAERQRQFARDLPAAMGRDGLIRNLTFQEAADLIDPEVLT